MESQDSGIDFSYLWLVVIFFVMMNIGWFLVVVLFLPFYNDPKNKTEQKIGIKECVIIAYSGIRGAFPLIICLSVM